MGNFGWERQKTRFEHTWVVAPIGSGKTTLLKALAAYDIPRVAEGKQSLIIMDSEGQLLDAIQRLKIFETTPLHIIDPEHDMGLNPFAIADFSERNVAAVANNITYFIGSLLDGVMTPKQEGLFRRVVDALLHTESPTLLTLLRVLEGSQELTPTNDEDAAFFSGAFKKDTDFRATRDQLVWRVDRIFRQNPTFKRIFADPRGIHFDALMNEPRVTLINLRRDLWEEEGVSIFGRLCLAQIKRAGFQRNGDGNDLSCFVYLDEAHLAIKNDQNAVKMLDGIRKYNVGLVLAHQFIGQLTNKEVFDSLYHNVGTIMASQARDPDPKVLASAMNGCDPQLIKGCRVGQFAIFIRGEMEEAKQVLIPAAALEQMPQRPLQQLQLTYQPVQEPQEPDEPEEDEEPAVEYLPAQQPHAQSGPTMEQWAATMREVGAEIVGAVRHIAYTAAKEGFKAGFKEASGKPKSLPAPEEPDAFNQHSNYIKKRTRRRRRGKKTPPDAGWSSEP